MKTSRIFLWMGVALLALVISLTWMEHVEAPVEAVAKIPIVLTGPEGTKKTLFVETADNPAERATGLMFRTELTQATGMLFIFEQPTELAFWMKNTLIPLDILFFDDKGIFVSRTTMDPCTEDPCVSYPSAGAASYALEVNRGESTTVGVGDGWILVIP